MEKEKKIQINNNNPEKTVILLATKLYKEDKETSYSKIDLNKPLLKKEKDE